MVKVVVGSYAAESEWVEGSFILQTEREREREGGSWRERERERGRKDRK